MIQKIRLVLMILIFILLSASCLMSAWGWKHVSHGGGFLDVGLSKIFFTYFILFLLASFLMMFLSAINLISKDTPDVKDRDSQSNSTIAKEE
ncbi:hypothetical protein BVX99_01485 [bacterium F16]|nr:hypothetical protein BVX99_01485 [bacterium F16]